MLCRWGLSRTCRGEAGVNGQGPLEALACSSCTLGLPLVVTSQACVRQCLQWGAHVLNTFPGTQLAGDHKSPKPLPPPVAAKGLVEGADSADGHLIIARAGARFNARVPDICSIGISRLHKTRQQKCKQPALPYLARTLNSDSLHPGHLGRIMMRIPKLPQDLAEPPLMLCCCPVGCLKPGSPQSLDCSIQLRSSLLDGPCPVSALVTASLHGKRSTSREGSSSMPMKEVKTCSPLDRHATWNGHPSLHAAQQEEGPGGMQAPNG